MAREVTHLTPEGREALDSELETLLSVRRREVVDRIHNASEAGGTVVAQIVKTAIEAQGFAKMPGRQEQHKSL